MSDKRVFLDYTFEFDPAETWSHLYEFEKSFGDFLATKGFESYLMNAVDGAPGRRIMCIRKKKEMEAPPPPKLTSQVVVVKPK